MKKRLWPLVFALLAAVCLAGCGGGKQGTKAQKDIYWISVDGVRLDLPCKVDDILALGYDLDPWLNGEWAEVPPGNVYAQTLEREDGCALRTTQRNSDKNAAASARDLPVIDIAIEDYEARGITVEITGGVTFGYTMEQVKSILGEPDKERTGANQWHDVKSWEYGGSGCSVELYFWDGAINKISVYHDAE